MAELKISLILLFLPVLLSAQKISFAAESPEWEMRFTLDKRDTSKIEYIQKNSKILTGYLVKTTVECLYDSEGQRIGEVWTRAMDFYSKDWIRLDDILIWNEIIEITGLGHRGSVIQWNGQ